MSTLQERTRYEPAEVEPRIVRALARRPGSSTPSRRARRTRTTRSRSRRRTSPARCTWATRSTARSRTRSIRYHRMRGPAHEVDPRHRPRRHRHPDAGREAARARGHEPRGARPRGVRRARLGVARAVRRHDHRAVQAPGRLAATTTTSASRWTRATSRPCTKVFVALYEKGLIYRDNYMVNWDPGSRSAISDLEVEDREVDRHALLHRLPARGRHGRGRRRHRAPRDDARRHRRRGAPRRRALPRT